MPAADNGDSAEGDAVQLYSLALGSLGGPFQALHTLTIHSLNSRSLACEIEGNGDSDTVEGVLNVAPSAGFSEVKTAHFQAADDIPWDQVDRLANKFGFIDSEEQPHTCLKGALSLNVSWDQIEKDLGSSDFWIQAEDPKVLSGKFTAYQSKSSFNIFRRVSGPPPFAPLSRSQFPVKGGVFEEANPSITDVHI